MTFLGLQVESLTAARQAAVSGSEPADAVRAVNALLTALDSLKGLPNVMLLTTSNITEAIDAAFLDRVDIKAYLGPPSLQVCDPPIGTPDRSKPPDSKRLNKPASCMSVTQITTAECRHATRSYGPASSSCSGRASSPAGASHRRPSR